MDAGRATFFFPVGAILEVVRAVEDTHLLRVLYEGREVSAFARDLERRAELINE
jgi:hypothetical protein